jgi:hypothetical protein
MSTHFMSTPIWSTAAYGHTAETSPQELSVLGEHLNSCRNPHGHATAFRAAAQAMHGFGATRFVTTLLVVGLLIGVAFLVF